VFHQVWNDQLGGLSVSKAIREKPHPCQECGHSSVVHRSNGACYSGTCLCGWVTDMNGAQYVKSSGQYAGECSPVRKKNRGARVGPRTRGYLLKIPCYFCGGKAESLDHFVARSRGGSSDRSNLVSACLVCNGMKSDKSYDELIEFCRSMETAVLRKTALRHVRTFQQWKEQAKKILAWHEKRMGAKNAHGPEYMLT
jgi:5-methylcytosine-specific restriction endonuclease McrA